jgi:hypothetical protein
MALPRAPLRQSSFPTQENTAPDVVAVSSVTNTVSVTGSVAVSGVSGTFNASATSATPTYTDSTTQALSLNLAGDLRAIVSSLGLSASVTSSQVTITASATQLFASGASIIFRQVTNPTTTTIYLGASGVTTGNGHIIPGPAAFDMQFNSAALFGIVTTGSVTVSTIGW